MTVIDAHVHVWDLDRAEYPWLTADTGSIHRTIGLDEIRPAFARAGVGAAILVQSADNAEDTANMIAEADRAAELHGAPAVAGIVGWVPLDEPDRAAGMLEGLRRDPRLVGIRNLIHDRPDPDWILRDDVTAGLGVLADAGMPFDYVTGSPAALRHVPTITARHPALRVVIDHLGKPPIGGSAAQLSAWRDLLAAAAENPLTHAKVSGLYAGQAGPDALRPVIDIAVEVFGPSRLIYGGDWPIADLFGGYDATWDALSAALAHLDEGDHSQILGETAARFYRLDPELLASARAS